MSANALPVITVHGHASNPGTVTEPTVYEQALARSLSPCLLYTSDAADE